MLSVNLSPRRHNRHDLFCRRGSKSGGSGGHGHKRTEEVLAESDENMRKPAPQVTNQASGMFPRAQLAITLVDTRRAVFSALPSLLSATHQPDESSAEDSTAIT